MHPDSTVDPEPMDEESSHAADTPAPEAAETPALAPVADAQMGARDLLVGGLGLVATAVVTLALLNARPAPTSAAVSADVEPRAVSSASPAAAERIVASGPSWNSANRASWLGGSRKGFAYEVDADNLVGVWMRSVRPTLVVRCMSSQLDVFVMTESAAAIEPKTEDHTVTLRFDGAAEAVERWPDSAQHDALFAPDGAAFAERLIRATTLEFGFTPHNAPRAVARFNVSGLEPLLTRSARECTGRK